MSDDRQKLIDTVTEYVQKNHGGDWARAFVTQDTNDDGKLSTEEVVFFLAKAGIGYRVARWAIALQVVKAMDDGGDGFIGVDEFKRLTSMMAAAQPEAVAPEVSDTPMVAYNNGKADVKGVKGEGRPYNNPYPEGTQQHAEYTRGYRENIGY